MTNRMKLAALDTITYLTTLAATGAAAWWFNTRPEYMLLGDSGTARVVSVAMLAFVAGGVADGMLDTVLTGSRSRLAATVEPRTNPRSLIATYTIDWQVRPFGHRRIRIHGAGSMPAAMRRATSGWRLRYLNWNTPAGAEIAWDLQPTAWRTDRTGTAHVGGPLYTAGSNRDQTNADYLATWAAAAKLRSVEAFEIARAAGVQVDAVHDYLEAEVADPEPRWTARDLIAFHTLNARGVEGGDVEAVVHEEMRQADRAAAGRHSQIGRVKATQYR